MSWANFHTHCHFCDGVGEPQQYVGEAIKQGVKALGFTSHAPVPFPTNWAMKYENLASYCQSIRSLRQNNSGSLPIFLGLEIDFIPGVTGHHTPVFQSLGLDYVLGSVHFVDFDYSGTFWTVDCEKEIFAQKVEEIYKGNIRELVEKYYKLVREMIQTECPDVIGHLDVIKKNNGQEIYFSEDESWYKKEVIETLQIIALSRAILEVNTGGIVRKKIDSPYPSTWILERCLELRIPIMLNSDAHIPEHITAGFEETAVVLRDIGFKELYLLSPRGWNAYTFSDVGLKLNSK